MDLWLPLGDRVRVPPLPKPPRKALPYAKVLAKFTRSWLTPTVLEAQKAALQAKGSEMEEFLEGRHPEVQREQSAKRMALVHSGHFPGRFSLTGRKGAAICQWNLEMNWKGGQAALSARSSSSVGETIILQILAMGSAEPDCRRRVKPLWDIMVRFQLAMHLPDRFDDAATQSCDCAYFGGEGSSRGIKWTAAVAALHPKHSPLAPTSSMRLAARGADILSSGPPRRSHMLCLWRALQTPPVGDGPVQRRPVQHISPTERAGDAVDGRRDRLSMCVPCLAPGATRAGRVYLDRRLRRHGRTQRQEASDAGSRTRRASKSTRPQLSCFYGPGLCHSGSLLCIPRSCPMCSRPRTKNATRVAIFFCGGAQKQRYKRVIIRSPRALSGSTTNLAGCKSCSTNRAADTCFRAGFDHGWHEHVTGSQDARTAAVFFLFW